MWCLSLVETSPLELYYVVARQQSDLKCQLIQTGSDASSAAFAMSWWALNAALEGQLHHSWDKAWPFIFTPSHVIFVFFFYSGFFLFFPEIFFYDKSKRSNTSDLSLEVFDIKLKSN